MCAFIIYGVESRISCVGRRAGFRGLDNRDSTQDEEGVAVRDGSAPIRRQCRQTSLAVVVPSVSNDLIETFVAVMDRFLRLLKSLIRLSCLRSFTFGFSAPSKRTRPTAV